MPGNKKCDPGCTCEKHSADRRARLRDQAVAQAQREGHEQRAEQTRRGWREMDPAARRRRVEKVAESMRGRTWTPEAIEVRRQGLIGYYKSLNDEQRRARTTAARAARSGRRTSAAEISVGAALDFLCVKYEPQAVIERYAVDFLLPDISVVIEVDGAYWHDAERDKVRDARLSTLGYWVARIPEKTAKKNGAAAVAAALVAWGHARGV